MQRSPRALALAISLLCGAAANGCHNSIGDLDGDHDLDVVASSDYEVVMLVNHGDGSFAAPSSRPVQLNAEAVRVLALDGSGLAGILCARRPTWACCAPPASRASPFT